MAHLTNKLVKFMLKVRLRGNLRDEKTKNANDRHIGKVKPQSDEILNKLESSNGHACRTVLDHPQYFINRNVHHGDGPLPLFIGTTPRMPSIPTNTTATPSTPTTTSSKPTSHSMIGEKPPTKGEFLATQANSITTMARILKVGSVKHINLLETRMIINI